MVVLILIIVVVFNKIDSTQTKGVNQPNPLIAADVGDNVTLHCFRLGEENTDSIIWYKQKVGHEPRVLVTVQHEPKYENDFKSPKFSIEKEKEVKGSFHLKIANVDPSDEAMYYCGFRDFLTRFGKGTFLAVADKPKLKVFQSSTMDSVPAGASVTLQCSVFSESRTAELQVLWFRASPQSHPQIISTHHNSSHQCESSSSTHTCVYNFSKNILSLNDTGTYYCAVAVCGKIIFGNGTRVELERSVDPVVICLTVSVGVCVLLIFALTFAITCKMRNSEQHSVTLKQGSVTDKTFNQDCAKAELNYAALHFNEKRSKRGRVKKHQSEDILYSDVKYSSVT